MTETGGQLSFQVLFDVAIGLLGLLGGWILGTIWEEVKQARADHARLATKIPETYARRDDMTAAIERLEGALNAGITRIYDKIDGKADKPHR